MPTHTLEVSVAQLALASTNVSRPARLLAVDDTQASLNVEGPHAELWNLHVRTGSDETWRTVGACYEFDSEWRLTSLRTTPGCAP